jgi:hypothetical protein
MSAEHSEVKKLLTAASFELGGLIDTLEAAALIRPRDTLIQNVIDRLNGAALFLRSHPDCHHRPKGKDL